MKDIETQHTDMVTALAKPGQDIQTFLTGDDCHLWHMATGISTEAAELWLAIIQADSENVLEELGDLEFYINGFRQGLPIDWDEDASWAAVSPKVSAEAWLIILAGDILDLVKKRVIYRKEIDTSLLQRKLAEMDQGIRRICVSWGITRENALEHNMAKLAKRYEGYQYSDQAAQERRDKTDE